MEAFSFLNYWRAGGAPPPLTLSALSPTALQPRDHDDDHDDGPFFDLQFTVPDDESHDSQDGHENPNAEHSNTNSVDDDESEGGDGEREFKFTLSPSSASDDLLFEGKLAPVEESSSFTLNSSQPNSKPELTASLLKSATKFRVFMLGLKKPKLNASEEESNECGSDSVAPRPQHRKLFSVKFNVEEVPIVSLFSSRVASSNKSEKQNTEALDEKRFSKELVHKYLKMVKPLHIRISRKYGDKLRFSGAVAGKAQTEADASETRCTNTNTQKQGNLHAGLRVVCKHLGKSRSASSAVAAAPPGLVFSRGRDDSLLQQQDGIQGAILHCKRSFNASRECQSSQLPCSVSDPLHEISPDSELSRNRVYG